MSKSPVIVISSSFPDLTKTIAKLDLRTQDEINETADEAASSRSHNCWSRRYGELVRDLFMLMAQLP